MIAVLYPSSSWIKMEEQSYGAVSTGMIGGLTITGKGGVSSCRTMIGFTVNGTTYVHWYDCITDYIL